MEDVTAMASTSSSASSFRKRCVSCGTLVSWTPRMWECNFCRNYLLCESCHAGPFESCEVPSSPPEVHTRDHSLSPILTTFECDGCGSLPIWNQRWRCTECDDTDLCEACYGALDAASMPPGHSKDHPMIAVEVHSTEWRNFLPRFSKPVDPQWSYVVDDNISMAGFVWEKRKPFAGMSSRGHMSRVEEDETVRLSFESKVESSGHISGLEKMMSIRLRNSASEPVSSLTKRNFDEKYKIFLSHAGPEKDFVEQLYLDLSRVHHYAIFFDKDDDSLPKGEEFPERILDAAKQCELAIVVLSREYFMRKWPMLELAAFVAAQKTRPELKILPVFYKLSVEEFKQAKNQQSFVTHWKQFPRSSISEDDIQRWKEALKAISRRNGIEYESKMGEVALRDRIVEAVYKRVKPELLWDDSHVQGKIRMLDMIRETIQKLTRSSEDGESACTCRIGLYGMGGSGKTTMCKVLGNNMMQAYRGNVCHVEFGMMDITQETVMLQSRKKLLQSVKFFDSRLLSSIDDGQVLHLLQIHIPKRKICLVIDNVSDDQPSIEEAKTLLSLPFKRGSLILVASRSDIVLKKLKIKREAVMKIPALGADEARALFSHHLGCNISCLLEDEKKALEKFVERCNFKVQGTDSQEYHPLALKVLGTRVGPDPEEWRSIRIDFEYHESKKQHPIFSILRSGYDALNARYQRMFIDIALSGVKNREGIVYGDVYFQLWCLYGERDIFFFRDHLVKILQAKSLVESFDAVSDEIHIHDLYRDFARMEVEQKELQHSRRCCFYPAGGCQPLIREGRVRIYNHSVSHVTKDILSCPVCAKAESLTINGCGNLKSIDVPNMVSLKLFHVNGCPQLTSVNLEGAVNLRLLSWGSFPGEFPNLTSLESLEGLFLVSADEESSARWKGSLDFSRSPNLDAIFSSHFPLRGFNFNEMLQLRRLCIFNCQHIEKLDGIEGLVNLEHLSLDVCSSLLEFPSLVSFPSLERFILNGAAKLKKIQGFASLTNLIELELKGGRELQELSGIESCTRLGILNLSHTNLEDFSWVSEMKVVERVNLSGTKIRFIPKCYELNKLLLLSLENCEALEGHDKSTMGICSSLPGNLQWFSVLQSWNLKKLPLLNNQSSLIRLCLNGTSVEEISGVLNCLHLERLLCAETPITSLPDLSCLASLKILDVHGCKRLIRMDNIQSLPALEDLSVDGCTSLLALPDLRSSKGLMSLCLGDCASLDPNSVQLPSEWMGGTGMEDVADEQADSDVERNECVNETSVLMDAQEEPVTAHCLWGFSALLGWVASWCTSLQSNFSRRAE